MRPIREEINLADKRVLVRVDFNVPIEVGRVQDDFKIRKALPTIEYLTKAGAKVILISHLSKGGETLSPVADVLNGFIRTKFVPRVLGEEVKTAVAKLNSGEVVLLENLRMEPGEQSLDQDFARYLADLADIYVNDAFPECHREVASTILLPKLLPAYAGIQLLGEVENLSPAFKNPEHPFLFILGGAKFSTKIPLIEKYLKLADDVFIGGALSNYLLKARGYEVGQSLVGEASYDVEKILRNKKLIIPEDVVVQRGNKLQDKKVDEVDSDEIILDVGEATIRTLAPYIQNAKLILWNGPLGKYEVGGERGTKIILKLVAEAKAKSIIGGGETVSLISQMGIEKDFSFVSTGGGATLDFLAGGDLPGLKALR